MRTVRSVGVSLATLLTLGLAPVLVAIGSAGLLGERLQRRGVLALVGALIGLTLLVGGSDSVDVAQARWTGLALAIGSAVGYAGVTLLSRRLTSEVGALDLLRPNSWSAHSCCCPRREPGSRTGGDVNRPRTVSPSH